MVALAFYSCLNWSCEATYWPGTGDEAEGISWLSVFLPYISAESFGSVILGQVDVRTSTLGAESILSSCISSAPRSQTFIWDQIHQPASFWMGCCDLDNTAMVAFEYCFWLAPKKKKKLYNTDFDLVWNFLLIYIKLSLVSFFYNVDFKSTFLPSISLNLSCEQNTVIYQQLCMKNFAEEPVCHFPNIFLFSFFCSDSVGTKSPWALWFV